MQNIQVVGPYLTCDYPFGVAVYPRDVWYVRWLDANKPRNTWQRDTDNWNCIVEIVCFRSTPNRYIISRTYPIIEANSLESIINRAMNEQYTRCT